MASLKRDKTSGIAMQANMCILHLDMHGMTLHTEVCSLFLYPHLLEEVEEETLVER